jgi:hypothetical protein
MDREKEHTVTSALKVIATVLYAVFTSEPPDTCGEDRTGGSDNSSESHGCGGKIGCSGMKRDL